MMNRAEFMKILRSELRRLPEDERNSALEYYEEYFDEAGPQKEQQVLENLGNPKKIAGQIKADYAMQQLDQEEMPTAKKGWSRQMGHRGHLLGADLHTGRYRAGMCSCCCIYNICRMCRRCDRRDCRGGSGQYRFSGTGSTGFSGSCFHGDHAAGDRPCRTGRFSPAGLAGRMGDQSSCFSFHRCHQAEQ